MKEIPADILGNYRLPERRLLQYVYEVEFSTLLVRFMSNKTWENKANKYVELQFIGVTDYECHSRPKIQPWISLNENSYRYADDLPLIHLNLVHIDTVAKKCSISFHDSFWARHFAFSEFEYIESKASKADMG